LVKPPGVPRVQLIVSSFSTLKGVSSRDRQLIESAEKIIGSGEAKLGFVNHLFHGRVKEEFILPYPQVSADETARCDALLHKLDDYLKHEHPSVQIDQEEHIPEWALQRLFSLGAMGVTIPKEYGGQGLGITSYNRVLERIGATCASSAVVVSAHQSIGCKAIMLFGTEAQKRTWLPKLATDTLSAFCLSEPNVGSDAAGQETHCELSADGSHYILNGEKKWATSGALSGVFTVMAKQGDGITALLCTPDMPGVEIYQKNRSKCGIRGTWQARIRFHNVKVPRENLLHREGQGLKVALHCLDYGRCTLSAGMLGSARRCMEQGVKWARTRYQFGRPLSDFELMQQRIAHMSALVYAMDAMLYMTTGMLDRGDHPIMVESAVCKLFCSEMGWQVINDAMQIMGGESYMTENEVERAFRDSRINLIVEGANEVMEGFIFAYGGKALAQEMIGIQNAFFWNGQESASANFRRIGGNALNVKLTRRAMALASQLYLGVKGMVSHLARLHPTLQARGEQLARLTRRHSHAFKLTARRHREAIVRHQVTQARIARNAMWLHAMACVIAKMDAQWRRGGSSNLEMKRDLAAGEHFLDLAVLAIEENLRGLTRNADESLRAASDAALAYNDTLPNKDFAIPERSPSAKGTGRVPPRDGIRHFS